MFLFQDEKVIRVLKAPIVFDESISVEKMLRARNNNVWGENKKKYLRGKTGLRGRGEGKERGKIPLKDIEFLLFHIRVEFCWLVTGTATTKA